MIFTCVNTKKKKKYLVFFAFTKSLFLLCIVISTLHLDVSLIYSLQLIVWVFILWLRRLITGTRCDKVKCIFTAAWLIRIGQLVFRTTG